MTDITRKSIGMLVDEYITTQLKIEVSPTKENIQRGKILQQTIESILYNKPLWDVEVVGKVIDQLRIVLRECWTAQETVMKYHDIKLPDRYDSFFAVSDWIRLGNAAIKAQQTNAARNKLIREIDRLLGENDITALEKTYG